jgi:hypothetical protein
MAALAHIVHYGRRRPVYRTFIIATAKGTVRLVTCIAVNTDCQAKVAGGCNSSTRSQWQDNGKEH